MKLWGRFWITPNLDVVYYPFSCVANSLGKYSVQVIFCMFMSRWPHCLTLAHVRLLRNLLSQHTAHKFEGIHAPLGVNFKGAGGYLLPVK